MENFLCVLMERFLWEHFGVDILSMIEDLFWERGDREDLMDALKFRQVWDHDGEILRIIEKPYFLVRTRDVYV